MFNIWPFNIKKKREEIKRIEKERKEFCRKYAKDRHEAKKRAEQERHERARIERDSQLNSSIIIGSVVEDNQKKKLFFQL